MSEARTLDERVLNRTLLARQGLLERSVRPAQDIIEDLVGLQAQEPIDPYVALWTRLADVDPLDPSRLLETRATVRMGLLRGTLHLVTARDARALYPILADVMARSWRSSPFAKRLDGIDIGDVVRAARAAVEERPMTPSELGAALAPRWPDRDPTSLAYAARFLLPLVQVPPRGLWGQTGRPTNTTAEAWLGAPMDRTPRVDELVRRYLRAFGPATVADIRVWSWLTGLREVVERLRPRLRTFRDGAGRELLDVQDAPIATGDEGAPIRFLPQYDNVFLSHADRSRILHPTITVADMTWRGGVLVDGYVSAAWRIVRRRADATLTVTRYAPLDGQQRRAIEEEGERLIAFLAPDAATRAIVVADA